MEVIVDERTLPIYLQKDIKAWVEGKKNKVKHLDCLWGELYGSINSAQHDYEISVETANYLRDKYLELEVSNV